MTDPATIPVLIEENLNELYTLAAKEGNLPFGVEEGFSWVNAAPNVWPNYIYNAGFIQNEAQDKIQAANALIEKGIAPPFWITGPKLNVSGVAELLSGYNFRHVMEWPGMAIDLEKNSIVSPNQNLDILEVSNSLQFEEWVSITQTILFNNKTHSNGLLTNLMKSGQVTLLLGYMNGKAVSTLMVYLNDSVAGFYMGTTLPEYRKMGISASMINKGIELARVKGCSLGVLQANSMSCNLYKSIGFQEYCTFDIYWKIGVR